MSRRVIAAIVAALLAVVGAVLIASYVIGADQRALAQYEPTPVLVVTADIPAGGALAVGENAELQELPAAAVVPGALSEPDPVSDLVAATDLIPGEQVLPQRFVSLEDLSGDVVLVPDELVQVTVLLAPERVLGGELAAGDTVGVVLSVAPQVGPYSSETILHRTLVSRVQANADTPAQDDEGDGATPAPGSQFITLALSAADAERVVWGAEHGTLWLTLEREDSDITGTDDVVTLDDFGAGTVAGFTAEDTES